HPLERGAIVRDLEQPLPQQRLHVRDLCGISAAEKRRLCFAADRAAEVVHQLERAGRPSEALAEGGEFEAAAHLQSQNLTARSPVTVMVTVYGSAMTTIRA